MSKPRTPRRRVVRPSTKYPPLSRKARSLIHHLIKVKKFSYRKAASLLQLKSHGDLHAMHTGRIGETPEMTAAVERAEARARRAFFDARKDNPRTVDQSLLKVLAGDHRSLLDRLLSLLPKEANGQEH